MSAIFIASGGNLAASFAASLANQLLISQLQRRGRQRLEQVRLGQGLQGGSRTEHEGLAVQRLEQVRASRGRVSCARLPPLLRPRWVEAGGE
jgi:hypothetical protein